MQALWKNNKENINWLLMKRHHNKKTSLLNEKKMHYRQMTLKKQQVNMISCVKASYMR